MKRVLVLLLSFMLLLTAAACAERYSESELEQLAQSVRKDEAPEAEIIETPGIESYDKAYGYAEEGASVRYIDEDFASYSSQIMVCMDDEGRIVSIKQRMTPKDGKTAAEALVAWSRPVKGEYHEEDSVAYFIWSQEAIEEQFGAQSAKQIQATLDSWEGIAQPKAEMKDVHVNQIVYDKNGLMVNVDTLRYQIGESIEIGVTYTNTSAKPVLLFINNIFLNDWVVHTGQDDYLRVPPSGRASYTYSIFDAGERYFSLMGIEDIRTIRLDFDTYAENFYYQETIRTNLATNPEGDLNFTQTFDESGKALLNDDALKLVLKEYDEETGRSVLYMEKPESAKWTQLAIDAVYNNYGALATTYCKLDKGARMLLQMDASEVRGFYGIDEITCADLYLTYYHSESLKTPIRVRLFNNGQGGMPQSNNQILYDGDYCTLRYAGWRDDLFVGLDVIVIECYNKSIDKNLSVYMAYDYILLDGARSNARVNSANSYPESMSRILIYADNPLYARLSNYNTAQFTLEVYEIRNGKHYPLAKTDAIKVNLH